MVCSEFQARKLHTRSHHRFHFGFFLDLSKAPKNQPRHNNSLLGKRQQQQQLVSSNSDEELKMVYTDVLVLVVRQDLKMEQGRLHLNVLVRSLNIYLYAATGMYAELVQSQRSLLRQWEQCGQAKIVVTCKNQQEMNKLKEAAESIGLPTFVVADAGRTQV
ncbi:Peptidyl-tRNA hydrolase [Vitis vinifera]|uniref:peptidyl-tRNA hydrolase n=1 Tax=Vitis vinifera TaxID=29760 RepID=A0A438K8R9_VITVI|nr:Peptidyl-tRNA hydrolase [Vitis vinifera]